MAAQKADTVNGLHMGAAANARKASHVDSSQVSKRDHKLPQPGLSARLANAIKLTFFFVSAP
jgi:hypothetical protein